MKRNIIFLAIYLSIVLNACNTAEKEESTKNVMGDTTSLATDPPSPSSEPPYDPDPTDTIPGDRYGINSKSKQTANLVRLALKDELKADMDKDIIPESSRKFIFFEYDLNDDGKYEIFVGLTGPFFCGSGGCTQFLLDNQGNVITKFSVSRYPIIIDTKKTNGYKNLFILSGGKYRIVRYNGKKYPSNPSVLTALKMPAGDGLPKALDYMNEPYPWFNF